MKEILSIGNIEDIVVPDGLPYGGAIKELVKDASGTGITIDLDSFYSSEPVELHNCVDILRYRFVDEGPMQLLVYCICSRPIEIYKGVTYSGTVIRKSVIDIEFSGESKEVAERRIRFLGR